MILPSYISVNLTGIPTVRSLSVTVTSTEVLFDFNNHQNIGRPFRGLIIVNLALLIPAGTTATLPIVFTSNSSNALLLTGYDGTAITVADIKGTGVYIIWHEADTNTLLLVTGL